MVPCVYCLDTGELRDEQVLLRGRDFYLCAPRGQLVEGYLAIAPYRCVGCLAILPREQFAELQRLKNIVSAFYGNVFGIRHEKMFYEQGRAGLNGSSESFPLHAHLCCLPLSASIHPTLRERYASKPLTGIDGLADETGPYVYVETPDAVRLYHGSEELERMRLKPHIAAVLGMPERGHWRDHPGDAELARLIERFTSYRERNML